MSEPVNEPNFIIEVTPEVMSKIHRLLSEEDDDSIKLHYSPYWKEIKQKEVQSNV